MSGRSGKQHHIIWVAGKIDRVVLQSKYAIEFAQQDKYY